MPYQKETVRFTVNLPGFIHAQFADTLITDATGSDLLVEAAENMDGNVCISPLVRTRHRLWLSNPRSTAFNASFDAISNSYSNYDPCQTPKCSIQ
jgi:hypothetical protein